MVADEWPSPFIGRSSDGRIRFIQYLLDSPHRLCATRVPFDHSHYWAPAGSLSIFEYRLGLYKCRSLCMLNLKITHLGRSQAPKITLAIRIMIISSHQRNSPGQLGQGESER